MVIACTIALCCAAPDGVAADCDPSVDVCGYLPAGQAPIKPGVYRARETHDKFVLSRRVADRRPPVPHAGVPVPVLEMASGGGCGMGAFNITFVSPPGLPNGAPAGLLEGLSGPPEGQPNFHFRGRFAKRTHTIRITGTCNGATETRLFRWSEP